MTHDEARQHILDVLNSKPIAALSSKQVRGQCAQIESKQYRYAMRTLRRRGEVETFTSLGLGNTYLPRVRITRPDAELLAERTAAMLNHRLAKIEEREASAAAQNHKGQLKIKPNVWVGGSYRNDPDRVKPGHNPYIQTGSSSFRGGFSSLMRIA